MIRLSRAYLGQEEADAVMRVLQDGYLGMGQEVKHFENELQNYISSDVGVACVNTGTSALQLAVQACDIGVGDEVIVPSITYVASFQAVAATGAIPVACDVDLRTGFMDVNDAQKRLSAKTKAIMPVHYGSGTEGLEEVYELAKKHGLRVIEDAAHSFGGIYKGKPMGAEGDVVCFSFDGIKNITCGEGGAVVSKDHQVIAKAQDLRLLGVERDTEKRYTGQRSWDFQVSSQGWRYHMSNINAAIGREQLKKIGTFADMRQAFAKLYHRELADCPVKPVVPASPHIVPHIFPILVPDSKRDALKEHLSNQGIETGFHYKPNHLLELFKGDNCPNADQFGLEQLTLPLHCHLSEVDVLKITALIKDFYK
jgi:dTDP-4-amino-4,6-dideoxygalactose transaminase